jgi:hypothetical protein
VRQDENQEELQSYYKLTNEDMEHITKEWSEEFLVPVTDAKLSDTDTIGSPIFTRVEHVGQSSGTKKKKKQEEVQNIETDEEDNDSEDNGSRLLKGEGEDEVEGYRVGDEGENKGGCEATPLEDPPTGIGTP